MNTSTNKHKEGNEMTKYITKQINGKWAIFSRTGNKSNKANDKLVQIVELGMHTACAMADQMNREINK